MLFLGFILIIVLMMFFIEFLGFWGKVENKKRQKEGRKSIADSITFKRLFLIIGILLTLDFLISLI